MLFCFMTKWITKLLSYHSESDVSKILFFIQSLTLGLVRNPQKAKIKTFLPKNIANCVIWSVDAKYIHTN